jgi:hypothetical protein
LVAVIPNHEGGLEMRQADGGGGVQGVRWEEAPWCWYDGAIMMSRTQITLESEVQRRARQRASELGVSLAEYVRRLVARDLARPETANEVDRVFDLGNSGGADIARDKDSMIAEAFHSRRKKTQRR